MVKRNLQKLPAGTKTYYTWLGSITMETGVYDLVALFTHAQEISDDLFVVNTLWRRDNKYKSLRG